MAAARGSWPVPEPGAPIDLAPARWLWLPCERTLANTFVLFRRELDARGRGRLGARLDLAPTAAIGCSSTAGACSSARRRATRARTRPTPSTSPPYLPPGANVIGVEVLYYGHGEGTWPGGKPGFVFALRVEDRAGAVQEIVSDASWRARLDRAHKPGQFKRWYLRSLQEDFDARLSPAGWSEPGHRPDAAWMAPAAARARGRPPRRRRSALRLPDRRRHRPARRGAACARGAAAARDGARRRDAGALGPRALAARPARLVRVPAARLLRDRRRAVGRGGGRRRVRAFRARGRGRLRHVRVAGADGRLPVPGDRRRGGHGRRADDAGVARPARRGVARQPPLRLDAAGLPRGREPLRGVRLRVAALPADARPRGALARDDPRRRRAPAHATPGRRRRASSAATPARAARARGLVQHARQLGPGDDRRRHGPRAAAVQRRRRAPAARHAARLRRPPARAPLPAHLPARPDARGLLPRLLAGLGPSQPHRPARGRGDARGGRCSTTA